jgi:hypothetical protein
MPQDLVVQIDGEAMVTGESAAGDSPQGGDVKNKVC